MILQFIGNIVILMIIIRAWWTFNPKKRVSMTPPCHAQTRVGKRSYLDSVNVGEYIMEPKDEPFG